METDADAHGISSEYVSHFRDLCNNVALNWWRYRLWRLEARLQRRKGQLQAAQAALAVATRARATEQEALASHSTAAARRRVAAAGAKETAAQHEVVAAEQRLSSCIRRLEHVRKLEEPKAGDPVRQLPKAPAWRAPVRPREDDEGAEGGAERGAPRRRT